MAISDSLASIVTQQTALLAAIGALPGQVQAALATGAELFLYVDPVNGSDAAVGTQAAPLKSLSKAISLAPSYRATTIYLLASSTAVYPIQLSDIANANGYLGGIEQDIFISPVGYVAPIAPVSRPVIEFVPGVVAGSNVSPRFTGSGSVSIIGCEVHYAGPADSNTSDLTNVWAYTAANGASFSVIHSDCLIQLNTAPAAMNQGGFLNVQCINSTIELAAGVTAAQAEFLQLRANSPTLLAWIGMTLPSGVTAQSLVGNPSGLTQADGTPRALLTGINY